MLRNKTGWIIGILLILVIILGSLAIYSFFGKPYFSSYSNKVYNQGANDALAALVGQIQIRGYAQIPFGNGQTLILVPVQPNVNTVGPSAPTENSSG